MDPNNTDYSFLGKNGRAPGLKSGPAPQPGQTGPSVPATAGKTPANANITGIPATSAGTPASTASGNTGALPRSAYPTPSLKPGSRGSRR